MAIKNKIILGLILILITVVLLALNNKLTYEERIASKDNRIRTDSLMRVELYKVIQTQAEHFNKCSFIHMDNIYVDKNMYVRSKQKTDLIKNK